MFWPFTRISRDEKPDQSLALAQPRARRLKSGNGSRPRKLEFQSLESRDLFAIAPLGGEFQINTLTQFGQGDKPNSNLGGQPRTIDMADDGSFVAVWNDRASGVAGQRYNAQGVPQGSQFTVPTSTTVFQQNPSVAMDADGDFVVVWVSDYGFNTLAIKGQRFSSTGARVGNEFTVSSQTVPDENHPSVAIDSDGDFVVVWDKVNVDGDGDGIYGQRFNSSGVKQGGEFRINTYTTGDQNYPQVSMDSVGNFVVVWQSYDQDGDSDGVYGQRFSSSGATLGSEFQISVGTTLDQRYPVSAMDSDGDFVVVWESWGDSFVLKDQWLGIYARRYNSSGVAQGGEIHVNTYTTYYQRYPSVAIDSDGDFVVAWEGEEGSSSSSGVFAQAFSSIGATQGSEIHVNTYTTSQQGTPAVAMDASGNFVAMWYSDGQDGSGRGVYGQRYSGASAPTAGLSINDVNVTEGSSGVTNAIFTVTLSPAATQTVTVNYSTSDGSAVQPGDYTSKTGTLTFAVGTTSQTITISVIGDVLVESSETFQVNLSGAVNSSVGDGIGIGTITDDDSGPIITIQDTSVTEGNSGTANAVFTVLLSSTYPQPVTVAYSTANVSAQQPGDYIAKSGTLTFAVGVTTALITVSVVGDTQFEGNETFQVNLTNAVNASIGNGLAIGTINDDDVATTISISDVSVLEGASGTTNAVVNVTLSSASAQTISVVYSTANGTATSPTDYTAKSGTLTFAPGITTLPITISIVGDTQTESDETFSVNLSSPTGAAINDGTGIITITSDDLPQPTISINDVNVTEGNSGTVNAVFTVSLSSTYFQPITVAFKTNDVSAFGLDYNATSGTLTFAAGTTTRTITVAVLGDTQVEGDELFTVSLSSPTNATIASGLGIGTITDNDQSWYNSTKPCDVDTSGSISGIDLVYLVEALNTYGGGLISTFTPAPGKKIDVNNDTFLSGFDLVLIVEALNSGQTFQFATPLSAAAADESMGYVVGFGLAAAQGDPLPVVTTTRHSEPISTPRAAVPLAAAPSTQKAPYMTGPCALSVSSARGKPSSPTMSRSPNDMP